MDTVSKIGNGISALFTGIIGLAILAIILSNSSNTVSVLSTFFQGLSTLIGAAVNPVQSGGSSNNNIFNPTSSLGNIGGIFGGGGNSSNIFGNINPFGNSGVNSSISQFNVNGILGGSSSSNGLGGLGGITSILGGL